MEDIPSPSADTRPPCGTGSWPRGLWLETCALPDTPVVQTTQNHGNGSGPTGSDRGDGGDGGDD